MLRNLLELSYDLFHIEGVVTCMGISNGLFRIVFLSQELIWMYHLSGPVHLRLKSWWVAIVIGIKMLTFCKHTAKSLFD